VYAGEVLLTICCWRCGQPAEVEWIDIRTLNEAGPRYMDGGATCSTPGCVDWDGSAATSAMAPQPYEIQARAERALARLREVWP